MDPKTFRKRPVEIEAMQWDGTAEGATPIIQWILDGGGTATFRCVDPQGCEARDVTDHVIAITTLEGTMQASPGDWIIKGVKGEFYPCKPDIFAQTYAEKPSTVDAPEVSETDLLSSFDAEVWAESFQATYRRLAHQGYTNPWQQPIDDTGWLIGWFANALQVGFDQGRRTMPLMTGYDIAQALEEGEAVFVQTCIGIDASWNPPHESANPAWWRRHFGQIAVAAYVAEMVEDPDPIEADLPGMWERADFESGDEHRSAMTTQVTVRNVPNDGP